MGRFRPQSRHILPFIPQFSWILNEFTLFDLSAVGLGTTGWLETWVNSKRDFLAYFTSFLYFMLILSASVPFFRRLSITLDFYFGVFKLL